MAAHPGGPVPGILQARTLEWAAISFSSTWKWKVKVKLLSPVRILATPWTTAFQAPLSMGFSRQEYWSGVPLPSPITRSIVFFIPKSGGFLKEADIKGKFLLPEAYTWRTLLISATGTDVESTCLVAAKPPQRHQMVHGAPMSLQWEWLIWQ